MFILDNFYRFTGGLRKAMCHIGNWLKSNQGWITPISEAMTALGVMAGAIMFIWQWHSSKQVELNAVLVNSTPSTISILITNSGGIDVAIKKILVKASGVPNIDILDKVNGEKLVEKGKSTLKEVDKKLLRGIAVQGDYLDKPDQPHDLSVGKTDCSILIEMIDADGKPYKKEIKFECIAACFDIPKPTN